MEKRILKIIKNKDGHGTINYKLSLPKKWIEEIPYSGGILRREYWGKGKRNGTIVRKDLLYTKEYSQKYETDIFEIYEY